MTTPAGAICWAAAAFCIVALALSLAALALDPRRLGRDRIWAKPAKFSASLALHFATLGLALTALDEGTRTSAAVTWTCAAAAVATVAELAYVAARAARVEASHFNTSTPFAAVAWGLMGLGAFAILAPAVVLGAMVLADPAPGLPPALRIGWSVGLLGGSVLTAAVGAAMGARMDRHVGVERAAARRLPLAGWSLEVGDFRPAHFAGTHLMQAGPLAGLLLAALPPLIGAALTLALVALGAGLTLALLARASAGRGLDTLVRRAGSFRQ